MMCKRTVIVRSHNVKRVMAAPDRGFEVRIGRERLVAPLNGAN